jgi:hypothetical protein
MMRYALSILPTLMTATHAHQGHGQGATTHWHATDTWGFLLVGVAVALGYWANKRK